MGIIWIVIIIAIVLGILIFGLTIFEEETEYQL